MSPIPVSNSLKRASVEVPMLTLRASAGTSSGPVALPFFKDWIAFLISCLVGLPQLMGSSISAGGISGGLLGQDCSGVH